MIQEKAAHKLLHRERRDGVIKGEEERENKRRRERSKSGIEGRTKRERQREGYRWKRGEEERLEREKRSGKEKMNGAVKRKGGKEI